MVLIVLSLSNILISMVQTITRAGCRGPGRRAPFRHRSSSRTAPRPNEVVRPVHAKAMPVLLTAAEDWDTWLTGPVDEALALQRPLPDEMLRVVAADDKTDGTLPA
jgi:hypothetical protein